MIHTVIMFDKKTKEIFTRIQFWNIPITEENYRDFFDGVKDLEESSTIDDETPLFIGEGSHRVFHKSLMDNNYILTFWTDGKDEDRVINLKIRNASEKILQTVKESSIETVRLTFRNILGDTILTKFKISFIGSGGVGKTTLFKLLFGKKMTSGYSPSPGVTVSGDTFDFGTFRIHLWDFPGQVVFQDQWEFFLRGTDAIFLVTDSSFLNVMKTRGLMKKLKNDIPAVPLFIVANKQDLKESMQAMKIQRLLGQKTIPMIAAPIKEERDTQREYFLNILLEIACKSVNIEKPDVPLKDIVLVSGEEITSFDQAKTEDISWDSSEDDTRPIVFLLLKKEDNHRDVLCHLSYQKNRDIGDVVNLITALDKEDNLSVVEHGSGLVYLESSEDFDSVFVVNNNRNEVFYRDVLKRILNGVELSMAIDDTIMEQYVFECLFDVPLVVLSEHHILQQKDSLIYKFENELLNQIMERVWNEFETRQKVWDVAKKLKIPLVTLFGMLQIMIHTQSLEFIEPEE